MEGRAPKRGRVPARCGGWAFWGAVLAFQLLLGLLVAGSVITGVACPWAVPRDVPPADLFAPEPLAAQGAQAAPADASGVAAAPTPPPQADGLGQGGADDIGNATDLVWAYISQNTACEGNTQGVVRFLGAGDFSIISCKAKCEQTQHQGKPCVAIDYFRSAGWCNLYTVACASPRKKADGASSLKLQPRSLATPAPKKTGPPAPKTAIYAVLAVTPDHYKADDDLILYALFMRCSALCHGSRMPFHLIWGGFPSNYGRGNASAVKVAEELRRDLTVLQSFGWVIDDYSSQGGYLRQMYQPVYTEEEARAKKRWWHAGVEAQDRKDGWATYFKFFAWQAQGVDRVLMVDLDVFFDENPDPWVDAIPPNTSFMASPEGKNGYHGLNSHMMLLEPSEEVYDELIKRAHDGQYIPWTNTEQDVLESLFVPRFVAKLKMKEVVPHAHTVMASGRECQRHSRMWPPRNCSEVLKMCNFRTTRYASKAATLEQCIF